MGDGFSGPSSGFVSAVILVFSCFLLSLELFSLGGLGVACAGFLSFVAQLVCVAGEQGGGEEEAPGTRNTLIKLHKCPPPAFTSKNA